jgi:methionine--tRNA ligase beta chain
MDTITIDDFARVDIRIGTVKEATIPEGSETLVRCVVDFGEELGERVIFSGIKKWYKPDELVGKQLPYVVNLEPRILMNEESQGMLVAAAPELDGTKSACILLPDGKVAPGTKVI